MSKSSENVTEDQQQPGIPGSAGIQQERASPQGVGNVVPPSKIQHPFKQLSFSFQPFSDTLSRREDSSHVWCAT
jgi:hypothetical protein